MYIKSFVPKLSTSKVNMIAKPDKFLLGSIILETCSTALLQKRLIINFGLFLFMEDMH